MVPNWPIFIALFGLERDRNVLNMGSKRAHATCLCTPNSPKVSLEQHIFDPSLTHFWSQNSPLSRHFVTLEWPKCVAGLMGSKRGHFTCFVHPNGLGSFLKKPIFDQFLTHFLSQSDPFFKAFWDFRRAKTGHHKLKTRQKHLFWHSMWSKILFERSQFLAPGGPC